MPWKMKVWDDDLQYHLQLKLLTDVSKPGLSESENFDRYVKFFFNQGTAIPEEYIPLRFKSHNKVPKFLDMRKGASNVQMIASRKMKEVIEAYNPRGLQFVPTTIDYFGTMIEDYYFFRVVDLVDAIIPELSDVNFNYARDGSLAYYSAPPNAKFEFRPDAIADRAIWVDRYLKRDLFISDEMRLRMMAADLSGIDTYDVDRVRKD